MAETSADGEIRFIVFVTMFIYIMVVEWQEHCWWFPSVTIWRRRLRFSALPRIWTFPSLELVIRIYSFCFCMYSVNGSRKEALFFWMFIHFAFFNDFFSLLLNRAILILRNGTDIKHAVNEIFINELGVINIQAVATP